jgi:hypothetical protein
LERAASVAGGGGGGSSDPPTQFWNSAWGVVGTLNFPATTTTLVNTTTTLGVLSGVQLYAGRRYRITAWIRAWQSNPATAGASMTFNVVGSFVAASQNAHDQYSNAPSTGYSQAEWDAVIDCTADTPSASWTATANTSVASTVYGGMNSGITVEDVGPTVMALPPAPPTSDWAPIDAHNDPRYVNVPGDTMTGGLTVAANGELFKLITTAVDQYGYIGFYDQAGTRHGWLGKGNAAPGPMYYVSDPGFDLNLIGGFGMNLNTGAGFLNVSANGVAAMSLTSSALNLPNTHKLTLGAAVRQMIDLYGTAFGIGVQSSTTYMRSSSDFSFHKVGVHSDAKNDPGAGGTELMRLANGTGMYLLGSTDVMRLVSNNAASYIAYYLSATSLASQPARSGYIGFSSATNLLVNCEVAAGNLFLDCGAGGLLVFRDGGVENSRIEASGLQAWGRTSSTYTTEAGVDIRPGGQVICTGDAVSTGSFFGIHLSLADAAGQAFAYWRRTGNVTIGTVAQVATTGVAYNTTSHGPFKGNVRRIDDDDAIERLMRWRPVAFQWKFDADGLQDEDGTPSGPVEHGFIAQELAKVNPDAVTLPRGTWREHVKWRKRFVKWQVAQKILDDWQVADPETRPKKRPVVPADPGMSPFEPAGGDWSRLVPDLSAAVQALVRRVERQDDELRELRKLLPKH